MTRNAGAMSSPSSASVAARVSSVWRWTGSERHDGENVLLTIRTSASRAKCPAFRAATSPPPKMTTRFPVHSTKSGIIDQYIERLRYFKIWHLNLKRCFLHLKRVLRGHQPANKPVLCPKGRYT